MTEFPFVLRELPLVRPRNVARVLACQPDLVPRSLKRRIEDAFVAVRSEVIDWRAGRYQDQADETQPEPLHK